MKPKIKVAVIGAGGWGYQHMRVFSAHPQVALCSVTGRTAEKTRARAEQFGVRWYTDIAEMLSQEKPDLVSISLPNEGHFDATLQVIQSGYPLLAEKPLVFELDQADRLLAEAEQRKLFFAINFNHRYATPVQKAKQAIEDGSLGPIIFATWRFGGEGTKSHLYNNLIETQCHGFDMLEYLCGPVDSVCAEMTDMTGIGYSSMVVALRFASGAVGALIGSYDSSYAYPDTHWLEINGVKARVVVEDTVKRYSFQQAGNETRQVWEAGYFNDRQREFHRTFDTYLDAMIQAFLEGKQPPVHARAGRRALQLALATVESFDSGKRVFVR